MSVQPSPIDRPCADQLAALRAQLAQAQSKRGPALAFGLAALDDRLVGMVTDRDIAIRGVGMSLQPNAKVRAVMSSEVLYCFEDDDIGDVLANMADMQIRRLPVVDRDKRLVGILSLSDVAGNGDMARAGKVLCEIARPSALHSQAV